MLITQKQIEVLRRIREHGQVDSAWDSKLQKAVHSVGGKPVSSTLVRALLTKGLITAASLTINELGAAVIDLADRNAEEAGVE